MLWEVNLCWNKHGVSLHGAKHIKMVTKNENQTTLDNTGKLIKQVLHVFWILLSGYFYKVKGLWEKA